MSKTRTVKDLVTEISQGQDRAAVYEAIVNWLRTHYISRDGGEAQRKISRDGSPVPETVVEDVACELENASSELRKHVKGLLAESA